MDSVSWLVDQTQDYPEREWRKDETIISTGKVDNLVLVTHGQVSQIDITEAGDPFVIHYYQPPCLLPLMVWLTQKPNRFIFKARSKVKGKVINLAQFENLIRDNPDFWRETATGFAKAVDGLTIRLIKQTSLGLDERIYQYLVYLAGKQSSNGNELTSAPTQAEIAAWFGVARESVNRSLQRLKQQNKIQVESDQIKIID